MLLALGWQWDADLLAWLSPWEQRRPRRGYSYEQAVREQAKREQAKKEGP